MNVTQNLHQVRTSVSRTLLVPACDVKMTCVDPDVVLESPLISFQKCSLFSGRYEAVGRCRGAKCCRGGPESPAHKKQ